MDSGQDVQLLFGMESLDDAVRVLECFCCYERILARFQLESMDIDTEFSIHLDEQVNEQSGSKYIMANYDRKKIVVPNDKVQVLSITGWVEKNKAASVLSEISSLKKCEYKHLISNAE